MTPAQDGAPSHYVLGHAGDELERLNTQAALVGPITRRFFQEAGVSAGMRVLDVGSGGGDVAVLARELVGDSGEVVGADRSEQGIASARARAAANGWHNVTFHVGDPSEMAFDPPFDVVLGRYVLMFQPDPAAMLRRLAKHVRPGGIVVFHEADCSAAHSIPVVTTYDRCWKWVIAAMQGADTSLGAKFPAVFIGAGLPAPTMRLEALVGGSSESSNCIDLVVGLLATLLPQVERFGLATAIEVDIGTLRDRLMNDTMATSSLLVGRSEIGAWCRA
jgi:2-polyprenyl-3-methyl-5-hydroxy-6-metoxy-1,4-benzoquinol methylase